VTRLLAESSRFFSIHLADVGHNHLATLPVSMQHTLTAMSRCELERACRE